MRQLMMALRRDDGAAIVEFAVVLGLILLSAAAAMLLVGAESERSLATLANWELTESGMKRHKADTPIAQEDSEKSADPVVDLPGSELFTADQPVMAAVLAALAVMCYLAIRRRRGNRFRALEQLDEDRELLEQVDDERFRKRQQILNVLAADPLALVENRLEVRHLMTTGLRTVRPKTSLDELRAILAQEHVRHFPVITEKGRLAGIVSDRDLMNHVAQKAADVMCCSLITVKPTSKLGFAVAQMINRNISCLPVTEGDALVGILTTTDLVLTLQCMLQLWQRRSDFPIRPQAGGAAETDVPAARQTGELEPVAG